MKRISRIFALFLLARDYMTQAGQALKEVGVKDSSEAHIRKVLQRKPVSDQPSGGGSR